jgi:TrmH family RNA methyltransferase
MNDLPRCTSKLRNEIRELHTSRGRRDTGAFLVEGPHACDELASSSANVLQVVLRDDASPHARTVAGVFFERGIPVLATGARDMERMSDMTTAQDVLAVVEIPPARQCGNRIIILDGISDPGNLGTIIRTAAWFGFNDVLLLEGSADPFAPKVVRSSVGALLHISIQRDLTLEAMQALVRDVPLFAAATRGGQSPDALHGLTSCAIVIGSEAHGVRPELLKQCSIHITIPGSDSVESLNASIAAAILMYEAR